MGHKPVNMSLYMEFVIVMDGHVLNYKFPGRIAGFTLFRGRAVYGIVSFQSRA